jgi:hypothetical protein
VCRQAALAASNLAGLDAYSLDAAPDRPPRQWPLTLSVALMVAYLLGAEHPAIPTTTSCCCATNIHVVGVDGFEPEPQNLAPFHMSLRTMLRGASLSTVASGTQGQAGT